MWARGFGLVACALVALVTGAPTADRTERQGEHFKVVCHFENAAVADRALEAVEAVWPFAGELYDGLPDDALDEPLVVNLYRNRADYDAADQALTGGKFEQNMAFAHWDTKTAHVALQPDLSDEALETIGVPAMTLRLLAHEAAHLARFSAHENFRSHPDWIVHGAASWIDAEVMGALGESEGLAETPFTASHVLKVQRVLASNQPPGAERIFKGDLDALGFYERYGLTHLFFRFLLESKNKRSLAKVLTKARKLGGGSRYQAELKKYVFKTWNERKLKKLDEDFREYVDALEPEWDESYRALDLRGTEWVQTAFPDKNAIAWRVAPMDDARYTIRGEFQILPGTGKQMNVLLDRSEEGFVSVAFVAGFGLTAFEYSSKQDEWKGLGDAKLAQLEVGETLAFEVAVEQGKATARVGSATLTVEPAERSWTGPWGVGAQAGTAGIWRDLTVE